jgi:hypothetical protein
LAIIIAVWDAVSIVVHYGCFVSGHGEGDFADGSVRHFLKGSGLEVRFAIRVWTRTSGGGDEFCGVGVDGAAVNGEGMGEEGGRVSEAGFWNRDGAVVGGNAFYVVAAVSTALHVDVILVCCWIEFEHVGAYPGYKTNGKIEVFWSASVSAPRGLCVALEDSCFAWILTGC